MCRADEILRERLRQSTRWPTDFGQSLVGLRNSEASAYGKCSILSPELEKVLCDCNARIRVSSLQPIDTIDQVISEHRRNSGRASSRTMNEIGQ